MTCAHSPSHPGDGCKECLGARSVTETAAKLGLARVTLSRIMSGTSGVSVDMAYRLGDAFGTSPELWGSMKLQYYLFHAGTRTRR